MGNFISTVDDTVYREPRLRDTIATTWLAKFQRNYKGRYGKELDIPRWSEIKDKYDIVSTRRFENATRELNKAEDKVAYMSARVTKYTEATENARSDIQKEKAFENLEKANAALAKAIQKRDAAQMKVDQYTLRV